MSDAFYVRDGDRFLPTELTRGPWDPDAQHAGPPAALLGRAVERLDGSAREPERDLRRRVGRVTFEILRPVPIGPLEVSARVVRPGRSVEMVVATLHGSEQEVMRAAAWRLREAELDVPEAVTSDGGGGDPGSFSSVLRPGFAPPGPHEGEQHEFFSTGHDIGYHTAMDYRFVAGSFLEPGPATVWMRPRVPLVAGEEPTPLERLLVAADAGNGISAALDFERFTFINVDLSVHINRAPSGEWVCLDAITIPERTGTGISDSALYDERGPVGRAVQTLLVAER